MSTGLLEKVLRQISGEGRDWRRQDFSIGQAELCEGSDEIKHGFYVSHSCSSDLSQLQANLRQPNRVFDPNAVETIARQFVGQEIEHVRVYAYREAGVWNHKCFDLDIGTKLNRIISNDTQNEQSQWIQEHETLFREILAIFNGRDIKWKECGTLLPDEHQARITPERIRDVYQLLWEHNLYPNIQSSTKKEEEGLRHTGFFRLEHCPISKYHSSNIHFAKWLWNSRSTYQTFTSKDIAAVEADLELLKETVEGKRLRYNLSGMTMEYKVEAGTARFVRDVEAYIGGVKYEEQAIKSLIAHYFRAFCVKEQPVHVREMGQYETFQGFVAGVVEHPTIIRASNAVNIEFMYGYNVGRTYRRILDCSKKVEICN